MQNLIETFSEFKDFKNIDRETMMIIIEDVFKSMLVKKYGNIDNFDIIVNIDKGDLEIWRNREIVDEVEDENTQISYLEAIQIEPDFEIGEDLSESIKLSDFGRREILSIKQILMTKVQEYKRNSIYKKYKDKIGELVVCEVVNVWKRDITAIDDEDIELLMPRSEQIQTDNYRKGDTLKAIVKEVELKNNTPCVILSRTSPIFIERLFELEVPEIFDGLITIKNVARSPGERSKITVESYDDSIDPVGVCVGAKGSRIQGVTKELRFENIDIINYTTNIELYITRALNPAKISSMKINETSKRAEVYMNPDQLSLAIGKGGHNIRLAGQLTGYEIDVYNNEETYYEDVDLQEFSDEIDQWVIDTFKSIGLDTARSILDISLEDLITRTDLEEETVDDVVNILKLELE